MKIKFAHPLDTKSFVIGIIASMTAVVVWDIIKYERKLLEHKHIGFTGYTNASGRIKAYSVKQPETKPILTFPLCCLWGCPECKGTIGGRVLRDEGR